MESSWMVGVLCLISATAFLCSAQALDGDFCASKPNGVYPNPNSCDSFIVCRKKKLIRRSSCRGRIYDPVAKRCKNPFKFKKDKLDCDVAIVGGGLSGVYMAYRLLKDTDEKKVCLFQKESRLGGRLYDFFFDEAPEISVGLGGWRIDHSNALMLDLVRELELETYDWTFKKPYLHESRGIFSDDREELKEAFPALRDSKFGKMSSSELFAYVWNDTTDISEFSTLNSFVSHRVTPEGAQYLSEVDGYKGDYTEFIDAAGYYEWLEATADFTGEYVRPVGGLSSIVNALTGKLEELGAHIYTCNDVRKIEKKAGAYQLSTRFKKVTAGKVVVAIPPLQLQEVSGTVAKQLQESPEFQSVQPVPVMKGGALFTSDTWSHLTAHQDFISNSDCLGQGFLHMGSGVNDEDVMHILYTDGECARKWRDVQTLGKDVFDKEVHRALEYKFNMTVPIPLETVYQYWDAAWHLQRGGTKSSMASVAEWAAEPLQGEDVFVVGEAYCLKRGWCEGVLDTCNAALEKGWGIKEYARRNTLKKKLTKKEFIDRLRRLDVPIHHA